MHPWEKVGIDYFILDGKDFLLLVDYFSKYPKMLQMISKTAQATVAKLKMIVAQQMVIADNMPFNSKEFKPFAKLWDFQIVTSSSTYPQSNGLVEHNVQSIKCLYKKAHDEGKELEF